MYPFSLFFTQIPLEEVYDPNNDSDESDHSSRRGSRGSKNPNILAIAGHRARATTIGNGQVNTCIGGVTQ